MIRYLVVWKLIFIYQQEDHWLMWCKSLAGKRENAGFSHEVILPKGIVEIVFNFFPETTFNGKVYDKNFIIPKCFIQGYHNSSIKLDLPRSQFLLV